MHAHFYSNSTTLLWGGYASHGSGHMTSYLLLADTCAFAAARHRTRLQRPSWLRKNQWHHRKMSHMLEKDSFDEVHKIVNLQTEGIYVVKILQKSTMHTTEKTWKETVFKKVKILNDLCHVNCFLKTWISKMSFKNENELIKHKSKCRIEFVVIMSKRSANLIFHKTTLQNIIIFKTLSLMLSL